MLGFIWALPYTTFGIILGLLYGPKRYRWRNGAFEIVVKRLWPKFVLGQTWGCCILLKSLTAGQISTILDRPLISLILKHEHVHVKQYRVWGPFFLFAYLLASLWAWLNKKHYYFDNYFESKAREESGY